MTTSPTLTTHYLAESDPRQHAFPHSPNTSDEEMEEKEHVNQNRQIIGFPIQNSVCFLLFAWMAHTLLPFSKCGTSITNCLGKWRKTYEIQKFRYTVLSRRAGN